MTEKAIILFKTYNSGDNRAKGVNAGPDNKGEKEGRTNRRALKKNLRG